MYTEFSKKKVFEQLTLAAASPAHRRHGRQKVSIPECDLTGRRSTWRSSSYGEQFKNETTVNLKSASFVVIMLLHKGLTHIQSQIKPRFLSGESFTLRKKKKQQQ